MYSGQHRADVNKKAKTCPPKESQQSESKAHKLREQRNVCERLIGKVRTVDNFLIPCSGVYKPRAKMLFN